MKKKILLRTLLLFVMLSVTAPSWAVTIRGMPSCGAWVKDRENKASGWPAMTNKTWLIGYLSGLSSGLGVEFWRKGGNTLDNESAYLWMDNYCRANPLKDTQDGADALFHEHTRK